MTGRPSHRVRERRAPPIWEWPGWDSNPHALRHRLLRPAWLPVTPPGRISSVYRTPELAARFPLSRLRWSSAFRRFSAPAPPEGGTPTKTKKSRSIASVWGCSAISARYGGARGARARRDVPKCPEMSHQKKDPCGPDLPGRPGSCLPGVPQIRTCPIRASGSSRGGLAVTRTPSGPPAPAATGNAATGD